MTELDFGDCKVYVGLSGAVPSTRWTEIVLFLERDVQSLINSRQAQGTLLAQGRAEGEAVVEGWRLLEKEKGDTIQAGDEIWNYDFGKWEDASDELGKIYDGYIVRRRFAVDAAAKERGE